jgi:hypothetical protein
LLREQLPDSVAQVLISIMEQVLRTGFVASLIAIAGAAVQLGLTNGLKHA